MSSISDNFKAPGVYVNEVDLTEQPAGLAPTMACIVIESRKGRAWTRSVCRTPQEFVDTWGAPDPSLGRRGYMSQLSALAYLRESRALSVTRAVRGALHGGVRFTVHATAGKAFSGITLGEENPYADNYALSFSDDMVMDVLSYGPGTSDVRILLKPNTTTPEGGFYFNVYAPASSVLPTERYLVSLSYRMNGMGEQMFVEDYVNLRSKTVMVRVNPNYEGSLNDALVGGSPGGTGWSATFTGGDQGSAITDADVITGYELYRPKESSPINLIINAGWTHPSVQQAITEIATVRRAIAILDIPEGMQEYSLAVNYRRTTLNIDNNHAALYAPWLYTVDRYNGTNQWVPPSGFVAATFARTDSNFAQWFSPAGLNRGNLNGTRGTSQGGVLGVKYTYGQDAQESFAENQINPILNFPGVGPAVIFGDNTLQTITSMLSYLPVRRMLDFVQTNMERALRYANFDPNDHILRYQLKNRVNDFLHPIKVGRGLESYVVVCDDSNNPKDRVAAGKLRISAAMTPVGTARQIELDTILTKSGANFTEAISSVVS